MKRKILIISLGLFFPLWAIAQSEPQQGNTGTTQEEEKQYPKTIEGQFDQMIEKSGNWEKYKVVKKETLYAIKKNMLDSVRVQKDLLREKLDTIAHQASEIKQLNLKIQSVESDLEKEMRQKNSIDFFGIPLDKGLYSAVVWGIIIVLAILLILFISKFTRSNNITQSTLRDFENLQNEYEEYRTKAIEREQKVRRQLQDEINKHRS
ncbi:MULTISPECIES: hypothetical protein [unclassified Capnocytophaga]|jgi:hypothetical protein|uniref:hypothetical protein n=1 Tax=unclassified Capnocytophaga TaxID=2640652 RepID=UPI000202B9DC|nr:MULTISPECIES: hypothetical protein [unclassified Capnocytophaga]EGD34111.1 putative secreted protein [Capnocytophaga sp. oral taxon 338 str. F0234]MEB3004355.1 hypothetical protein [Capnocytophaga sp. G2]